MKTKVSALTLMVAVSVHPLPVGADNAPAAEGKLETIGLRFEEARHLAPDESRAALEVLARTIDDVTDQLSSDRRAAAQLLAGEIRFAAGDAAGALESFERAERDGKKSGIRDDAALGEIRALEATGRDLEAAKAWNDWMKKYAKDSALLPEALLGRAWNAVRREAAAEARADLDRLQAEFDWLADDPRRALLSATLDWHAGETDAALASLDGLDSAAASYLKGLCLGEKGEVLASAAAFQDVSQRYPHSPLADPARIAKADVFLASGSYRSASDEYARVAAAVSREDIREEARVRSAACILLDGRTEEAIEALAEVAATSPVGDVKGRALYLRGEALYSVQRYEEAVAEYNRVLGQHFDHELAASAQYRVARSLDALDRGPEATAAYRAVVSGYPLAAESPAAAYLAGVGLLAQDRPMEAAPYFQIVMDRYAQEGTGGTLEFESPEHRELVEASLCLLQYSWWSAGDLGQVTGVPHLTLQKMPETDSPWRAWAMMFDADALASQGRHVESKEMLDRLIAEGNVQEILVPATRLLAWNHAQMGEPQKAMEIEERVLTQYAHLAREDDLGGASLRKAHLLFNDQEWRQAAGGYDEFAVNHPEHPDRLLALYQAGLCYQRLDQSGDAVDRWEKVVAAAPADPVAERAWARAGDLYFQAEHFEDAKRCFAGLLTHFAETDMAARGQLRIAQCDYNAGRDAEAVESFSVVAAQHPGTPYAREAERGIEQALYRLGQSEGGGAVLAQLVEEHPDSPFAADAQFEIATRAYEEERWSDAAAEMRRVVTQFPSFASADRAHYLMGEAHLNAGEHRDASQAWEQFLLFFPKSPLRSAVQFRLGGLRFEAGDYLQAAVDFTNVLSAEGSDETRRAARFNLALCQEQLGDAAAARVTLLEYRRDQPAGDPRTAEVALRLGALHEDAGETQPALTEYAAALAAGPDAALASEIHYRVGSCRESLGEVDAALKSYRKVLSVDAPGSPARAAAAGRLAAIHDERGETAQAIASYRTLLDESADPELAAAVEARLSELEASH